MQTKTRKPSLPKSVEKHIGNSWGQWASGTMVPIDVPMHICQRPLKIRNVYKYIDLVKGLDKNLFGTITVIKSKTTGKMACINGHHRINVAKIIDPTIKEVPAHVIEVDDSEFDSYGSALFSQFNGTVSKGLSNEELFYSNVLARDSYALYVESIIKQCGLSIGQVNADEKHFPVVYTGFTKCLNLGEPETIRAVELLKVGFSSVNDDVLHGLVFLLAHPTYAELADSTVAVGGHFEQWLTRAVPMFHGINDLKFKKYRQGAWEKGIAYGIAQSFAKFQRNNGLYAPVVRDIKKIYEAGFKDEDSGIL
jgi:hypothetical protein